MITDFLKLLISNVAIIIYEFIIAGVIILFIVKQNKKKQKFVQEKNEKMKQKIEEELNNSLINNRSI